MNYITNYLFFRCTSFLQWSLVENIQNILEKKIFQKGDVLEVKIQDVISY